jgi:hypothetical protein
MTIRTDRVISSHRSSSFVSVDGWRLMFLPLCLYEGFRCFDPNLGEGGYRQLARLRQKYGQGELAKRAATTIRYLERISKDSLPGHPVQLRSETTLEVWVDTDDRDSDPDLSILRCAADLDNLHRNTGARVLTDDFGMRSSCPADGTRTLRLPQDHRKEGIGAVDDVPSLE